MFKQIVKSVKIRYFFKDKNNFLEKLEKSVDFEWSRNKIPGLFLILYYAGFYFNQEMKWT